MRSTLARRGGEEEGGRRPHPSSAPISTATPVGSTLPPGRGKLLTPCTKEALYIHGKTQAFTGPQKPGQAHTTWANNSRHAHLWAAAVYLDARTRGCDHSHATGCRGSTLALHTPPHHHGLSHRR